MSSMYYSLCESLFEDYSHDKLKVRFSLSPLNDNHIRAFKMEYFNLTKSFLSNIKKAGYKKYAGKGILPRAKTPVLPIGITPITLVGVLMFRMFQRDSFLFDISDRFIQSDTLKMHPPESVVIMDKHSDMQLKDVEVDDMLMIMGPILEEAWALAAHSFPGWKLIDSTKVYAPSRNRLPFGHLCAVKMEGSYVKAIAELKMNRSLTYIAPVMHIFGDNIQDYGYEE